MSAAPDPRFMDIALNAARKGVLNGQTPFGACIVKNNELIISAHNRVWELMDITAHAEIMAIREACKKLKTIDLSECILYSTCEPCPMCYSAIHWAKIKHIVYGATIKDAQRLGFNELPISTDFLKQICQDSVELTSGFMNTECLQLFSLWADQKTHVAY